MTRSASPGSAVPAPSPGSAPSPGLPSSPSGVVAAAVAPAAVAASAAATRVTDLLVIGNGMVGHHLVGEVLKCRRDAGYRITVIGEERRPAYDRVHLSSLFDGVLAEGLHLAGGFDAEPGIEYLLGDAVVELDTAARRAVTTSGVTVSYTDCVLATGSYPFVPPLPGADSPGVFVYRTIDDLEAIRDWASGRRRGLVVGGGLLGLEAANALRLLGLDVTVVEFAPRLMAVQLDHGGGRALRRHIERLGITVVTGAAARSITVGPDGAAAAVAFAEGEPIGADLVVIAAGIRPRDDLARRAGLAIGERGGVVVDDRCGTSAPGVYAVGEVACHGGRVYGLVAPGMEMAEVATAAILGGTARFTGADLSTRLKLLGVDVASVGDPHADGDEVVVADPATDTWLRVVTDDERRVLGASLVGDVRAFGALVGRYRSGKPSPDLLDVLRPAAGAATGEPADGDMVCTCHNVTCATVRAAVAEGFEDVAGIKACTKAGTGCGSCVPIVKQLIDARLTAAGRAVNHSLCAHFPISRPELYEAVRAAGLRNFAAITTRFGTGHGCEICRPTVASILASLGSGYILDGDQAALQDSNDHFLANLQRDGTYSVVPRVPGGEITPVQLIAIGEVARDFDLYTKVTGGQRIDLFGARVEQLPPIWARLIAAGLESGHAYGKALRTVKSCVGTAWCRYGVQDAVAMAIRLETRYRGLRAPHKIKLAVSGCARECAEAQSKDVGVIATERGWNLYVGGNGGMRPAHAVLLAEDLDDDTLISMIDRYLMWYVRSAERLERTATWQRKLPGGIDFVRRVVVDDELGLAAEFESDMERHVATYECEWTATLADPERVARFASFINTDTPDPTIAHVSVRGQRMPSPAGAGR